MSVNICVYYAKITRNMDAIKLYYFRHTPNLGDLLSISIIERLFGKKVVYASQGECDMVGVGSILEEFICYKRNINLKLLFKKYFSHELNVWGSGFIEKEGPDKEFFIRKMRFSALRGKITLERVKKINKGDNKIDGIALGDPGLLSSYLIDGQQKKKFALGILPHYVDRNSPLIEGIRNRIRNSTVIDVREDPAETVKKISECEMIISSAMHGLVVADSLGVPNIRIKLSDKITGGDYKYRDYYSVFGIAEPAAIDLREHNFIETDMGRIAGSYNISKNEVAKLKEGLIKAFPFK